MSGERLERVDAYVLGEAFAGGGTATVHLGRRTTGPSPVNARTMAVKRLRAELAFDPQLVDLLVREAHVTSRLRHANLVPISDVVQHRGELLLVSEYVHGVSLRTALTRGEVPLGVAVALGRDVLAGLHAAHTLTGSSGPLGIVHRDVAPENIVVGVDGSARLVDFGIAWALGRGRYTQTGELRGKVGYLSSEHVNGEPVDGRADVYSLAVVLWEMLAGRPLFDAAAGPALLEQVMLGFAPPVRRHRPEVPPALGELLGRALAQDREKRPATAQIFERELLAATAAASAAEVTAWIERVAAAEIAERSAALMAFEQAAATEDVTEVSGPPADLPRPRRQPGAGRRSPALWLVALLGAALAATLAILVLRSRAREDDRLGDGDGVVAEAAAFRSAPAPTDPATTMATTAEMDSAAPARAPDAAAPRPRSVPPRRPKRRAPGISCDPPYITGADGRRTYKRECVL